MRRAVLAAGLLAGAAGFAETVPLDGAWYFRREGAAWRQVAVPHDWAIAGPFDPDAFGDTAKLPWKGSGEYLRSFPVADATGFHYLCFGGVMACPRVFVNGKSVGGCDYGYMSFVCDITSAVRAGENALRVTAHTLSHRSRWYPGAGICRSVRYVHARRGQAVPGTAFADARLAEDGSATVSVGCDLAGGGSTNWSFRLAHPHRWDVDDPFLYSVDVCGETVRYGVRGFAFTADDGFHLNGRRVQLRGVDLHADLGPLGMAFDVTAARRQLRIMRDLGVNAIRTSHNPPAPEFLDLCDEMGVVVWDECFDKWDDTSGRPKGVTLDDYVVRNLRALVRRDRSHPCVVVWSIGNEMRPRTKEFDDGVDVARVSRFRDAVRAIDATRPVAAGCDDETMAEAGLWDALDLTGWNYGRRYLAQRAHLPSQPLVYSESASAYSDYGCYSIPPRAYRDDYDWRSMTCDSYDHTSAPWSDIPDIEFQRMATDRYVAGEFVWTGIDYLGEPCPFHKAEGRPMREMARSSYFGIADICGIPKDRFYLYRSHWNDKDATCHLVPDHWNWAAGTNLPVYVYTSGDSAELFLNGRSLGRRAKRPMPADYDLGFEGMDVKKYPDCRANPYYRICDTYRLRWFDVPYEPGELRAACYRKGEKIGDAVVRTAQQPVAVKLTRDPYSLPGDGLVFVQVDLVDAAGVRCPNRTDRIRFALEGAGEIVAVGNGNPRGHDSFKDVASHPLFGGKAVVIVRPRGVCVLTASADGLASARMEFGRR